MQRFSANTNTQRCSERSQVLGEAAASVLGAFFLGCWVPSEYTPASVPSSSTNPFWRKMIFAVLTPRKLLRGQCPPLHKASLVFCKSILSPCHGGELGTLVAQFLKIPNDSLRKAKPTGHSLVTLQKSLVASDCVSGAQSEAEKTAQSELH